MKQTTFASTGFELVTKRTRKREFLEEMNLVVPWTELTGLIQPKPVSIRSSKAWSVVENNYTQNASDNDSSVKQNANASNNSNASNAAWCCAWQRGGSLKNRRNTRKRWVLTNKCSD